ncbi:methyltransferase domain-containing protein [Paenibacillus sp. FSL L8-0436]|uniref:class I SAM-dependent methyltransferase n=1 Tax=Paenibacillus sp. FSL L8-0436 TaxID=2954686 RepID=UPI003158A8C6
MKERIIETVDGIQDIGSVQKYNLMQRETRDRGNIMEKVDRLVKNGLVSGHALEIGPGPGYFGLEWLKVTDNSTLTGIEISQPMIAMAEENAAEYGLQNRVKYVHGDAKQMEFEDETFDLVISCFSLHEWEYPEAIIKETSRVLKKGGHFFSLDWRRDVDLNAISFIPNSVKDDKMREGLFRSIDASYHVDEIKQFFSITDNQLRLKVYAELIYGMYVIAQKV